MGKNLLDWVYTPPVQTVRPAFISWIWAIALLCQVGQGMLYWTWSGPDRNRQLVAAKMAVEGHGLSEPVIDAATGAIRYEPLVSWAPGYSRLAAALYPIFSDWGRLSQCITVMSILFVFGGLRWLIYQLRDRLPWKAEVLLLVMWAVSFTPFQHFTDTDLLSLGAALFASGFLLRHRNGDWFISMLLLLLAAWVRIAYVPFVAIPVCWIWWKSGSWKPSRTVVVAALTAGVMVMGYSWFFTPSHPVSGGVNEMLSLGSLYPHNLLSWDAFPVKAWVYISAEGVGNRAGQLAAKIVSLGLFTLSGLFFYRLLKPLFQRRAARELPDLSGLLILVAGVSCVVLGWLSLRTPAEVHDGVRTWTYVQETRYYGWALLLIELWTVIIVYGHSGSSLLRKLSRLGLLVVMGLGMVHGCYRHGAASFLPQHIGTRLAESEQEMVSIMEQVKNSQGSGQICLIPGEDIFSRDQVSLGILAGGVLAYQAEDVPEEDTIIDLRRPN